MTSNKSIAEWREQMLAAGIKTPVPLEELEIHLREEIEQQMKSGFERATGLCDCGPTDRPTEHAQERIQKGGKDVYEKNHDNPARDFRHPVRPGHHPPGARQASGFGQFGTAISSCPSSVGTIILLARPCGTQAYGVRRRKSLATRLQKFFQFQPPPCRRNRAPWRFVPASPFSIAAPSRISSATPPCALRRCREIRPARSRKSA